MTRKLFAVDPDQPKTMVVAEVDGEAVGYAHAVGAGISDGFRGMGYVFVQPDHRRHGIGTALFDEVRAVCTPERVRGIQLGGGVRRPGQPHGRGDPRLHAGRHPPRERAGARRRGAAARRGPRRRSRACTSAPLPDDLDEDGWHAFGDTLNRLMADTPDQADGSEPTPYPIMRTLIAQPWQAMCAWQDGRIVGLTCVMVRNETAGRLNTVLTAVDRELRGQGLATALKVSHALALRERGWTVIVTQNMEGNEAILAANAKMGFRRSGGHRDVNYDYR